MDKKSIMYVLRTLAKFYNVSVPRFVIVGKSPAYGRLKGKKNSLGITFYGEPKLSTVLHEFYHHLYTKNRLLYKRKLDERLAREFVEKWTPYFKDKIKE